MEWNYLKKSGRESNINFLFYIGLFLNKYIFIRFEMNPEIFTLVATGDSLISQKLSLFNEPKFIEVKKIIESADVAFTNFEALIRNEKGVPRYKMDTSGWMQNPRYVIKELKWMGFNLFSLANNHSMDYSEEGLLENLRLFREEETTHAGTGRILSEARKASYMNTQKGRVALIALNTRGEDGPASDPWKGIPGRAGVNPLRFIATFHLKKDEFNLLSEISKKLGLTGNIDEKLDFIGHRFVMSGKNEIKTFPYKPDFEGNINSIKNAKNYADYVVGYFRFKVISIVETFLELLSPSLGGISSVPMVTVSTIISFTNLRRAISTASTAVVMDRPLAFTVASFASDPLKAVTIANT